MNPNNSERQTNLKPPSSINLVPTPSNNSSDTIFQTFLPTKNKAALKSYYYGCIGIIPVIGLPFTILALVNGYKGLKQYRANQTPGAKGHAIAGIIMAYVEFLIFIILVIIIIIAFKTSSA